VLQLYALFLRLTLFYKGCTERSATYCPDPHKVDRSALYIVGTVHKLTAALNMSQRVEHNHGRLLISWSQHYFLHIFVNELFI